MHKLRGMQESNDYDDDDNRRNGLQRVAHLKIYTLSHLATIIPILYISRRCIFPTCSRRNFTSNYLAKYH